MDIESPSELYTLALVMWHFQRVDLGEASRAADATIAEQRGRVERFRDVLHQIFEKPEQITLSIDGGCVEAECGGLRFAALEIPSEQYGTVTLATLLGRCPMCGVRTMSEPFYNLAGLGKILERFTPTKMHGCAGQADTPPS